jgi:hypothetical protein
MSEATTSGRTDFDEAVRRAQAEAADRVLAAAGRGDPTVAPLRPRDPAEAQYYSYPAVRAEDLAECRMCGALTVNTEQHSKYHVAHGKRHVEQGKV